MPLINGMKMACEPCIRGHRSTKCTHANERLMVPVRKPGRPLSACPHPLGKPCGCGTVTAAIPRKQTCHCGTTSQSATPVVPRPASSISELPSPTKSSFKIQKSSRPSSSRKQSFDVANLERMDMNHVLIQPFEQKPQNMAVAYTNGYTMANPTTMYGFAPQYASMQSQYAMIPMQPPPHHIGVNGSVGPVLNSYSNGLEHVIESPLSTPVGFENGASGKFTNGHTCTAQSKAVNGNGNGHDHRNGNVSNGRSCCAPKESNHSRSSSASSLVEETIESQGGGCCGSKAAAPQKEPVSNGISTQNTPQIPRQILLPNGMPFNGVMYQQFVPQPTIFTYPPTYGSWQNPLQPSAWREGIRSTYAPLDVPTHPNGAANHLPFEAPVTSGNSDTIHTCGCGDTCQCIGCAAHPYNDATQDYVRSAYASMSAERSSSEVYSDGQPAPNGNTDGNHPGQGKNADQAASPNALTPSSTTSGNAGDDQDLSADNFLFVNYPFTGEGCGGNMQECPCGDDCECIGCTIHGNQIEIPCVGSTDDCPCGDDCQCIGCEIHKNAPRE